MVGWIVYDGGLDVNCSTVDLILIGILLYLISRNMYLVSISKISGASRNERSSPFCIFWSRSLNWKLTSPHAISETIKWLTLWKIINWIFKYFSEFYMKQKFLKTWHLACNQFFLNTSLLIPKPRSQNIRNMKWIIDF